MSTKTAVTTVAVLLMAASGFVAFEIRASRVATAELSEGKRRVAALREQVRQTELASQRAATAAPTPTPPVAPKTASPIPTQTMTDRMRQRMRDGWELVQRNPELRAALAAYHRGTLSEEYAAFLAAAKLTEAERERFLDLISSRYQRLVGDHLLPLQAPDTPYENIEGELRALLGPERYQQYRDFDGQSELFGLGQAMTWALYFTDSPLTPDQTAGLKEIVRRATRDPALQLKAPGYWGGYSDAAWERIVGEAAVFLSEPQLEAMREFREQSRFVRSHREARDAYQASQSPAEKGRG